MLSPLVRPGPMKVTSHGIDLATFSSELGLAFQTTASAWLWQMAVATAGASEEVFLGIRRDSAKLLPATSPTAASARA